MDTTEPLSNSTDDAHVGQLGFYDGERKLKIPNPFSRLRPWMSIDETREIIDPINAQVTYDYTRLTTEMRDRLDLGDEQQVDWCGFASWISFSLGAFLRSSVNNKALEMHPWWRRFMIDWVLPKLLTVDEWKGLADGNQAIYLEMRAFYDLVASFEGVTPEVAFAKAGERADELWDHPPFTDVETTDEDRYWGRHAVRSLILAAATDEYKQKCALIFSASVALSAIEQRRADEQIDRFFDGMIANRRWLPKMFHQRAKRITARLTTKFMTHFMFSGRFISVAEPLAEPAAQRFRHGRNIDGEIHNPWAKTALDRFWAGPDPHSKDWRSYEERMQFIVALFRTYQEVPDLLDFADFSRPDGANEPESKAPLFPVPDRAFVNGTWPEPYPEKWKPNRLF